MPYTVYVLFSVMHNKHYVGVTSNLDERLKSHNLLGESWTKRYRPWKIIYTKSFFSKTEALQYEKWLKTELNRLFKNYRNEIEFKSIEGSVLISWPSSSPKSSNSL